MNALYSLSRSVSVFLLRVSRVSLEHGLDLLDLDQRRTVFYV